MDLRTALHRSTAALLVAGAATGATLLATGAAEAAPADPAPQSSLCTPEQVSTTLVGGDAGMSNRHAAIQFTANAGETCTLPGALPVGLVGADNVLTESDAPTDAPPIQLTSGESAYIPLHWTTAGGPDQQQTPLAVTVSPNGADPVSLDWTLDPVDTLPTAHTIDTGATTPGTAPTE